MQGGREDRRRGPDLRGGRTEVDGGGEVHRIGQRLVDGFEVGQQDPLQPAVSLSQVDDVSGLDRLVGGRLLVALEGEVLATVGRDELELLPRRSGDRHRDVGEPGLGIDGRAGVGRRRGGGAGADPQLR